MEVHFQRIAWIIGLTVAGVAAGWLLDRWGLHRLRTLAHKSESALDDVLVAAFKGILPLWGALIGLRMAIHYFGIDPAIAGPAARVILTLAVFSCCLVAARLAVAGIRQATGRMTGARRTASILAIIAQGIVFAIGALVVLHELGLSITPMITALGVGGLAVALALQDTLGNLFAGLQLVASRQVKVGDYVKLDSGDEGFVSDITWRNTTIKALSNHMIVVPNAKLAQAIVQNHQLPDPEVAVLVQVGVSYDSDLEQVEQVTIATARKVMRKVQPALKEFDPFIRYHTFAESSINFSVILRATEFTERFIVMHEFIKALHVTYRAEGIVIPYPMRTVRMELPEAMYHEQ